MAYPSNQVRIVHSKRQGADNAKAARPRPTIMALRPAISGSNVGGHILKRVAPLGG